jgi:hypothetical protein
MAKRPQQKRTPSAARITVLDAEDLQPSDERSDAQEADILASLDAPEEGIEYQIRVFQLENKPNGNARETYLFTCEKDLLPELWDKLRDTYGTGSYRVRVRRVGNGANYQIHQMDRAVRSLTGIPAAPAAAPATIAQPNAIDARLDRLERLLEQRAAAPPMDMIQAFTLFEKMSARFQPATAAAPATDPKAHMEIFQQGIEFARELGAPGETSIADIAGKFLQSGALEKILSPLLAARQVPTLGAPALAAPAARPAPPPALQALLIDVLNQCGDYAAQGVDPAEVADFVYESIPMMQIRQLVGDPTMIDQLAIALPVVANNRGFFVALRGELENMILEDDGGIPDPGAAVTTGEPSEFDANGGDQGGGQVDAPANPPGQVQRAAPKIRHRSNGRPRA